jgi:hypothetical protein
MICVAAVAAGLGACRRIAIVDDFQRPYEQEGILLPKATRSYVLKGPPGRKVDIGLDFEEGEGRADRMLLTVSLSGRQITGMPVPGSQIRRAVCGVVLTRSGVKVDVQNLNVIRSAPFSLRIERSSSRSPSSICWPRRHVPSSALVQRDRPQQAWRRVN